RSASGAAGGSCTSPGSSWAVLLLIARAHACSAWLSTGGMPMSRKKVLVAGASGLVGHAAVQHFASLPDWDVMGLSRRIPADVEGATLLSVDLTDAAACERTFADAG